MGATPVDSQSLKTQPIKGRGALSNPRNRYQPTHIDRAAEFLSEQYSEGDEANGDTVAPPTELLIDHAKTIFASNRSPDVPIEQSINPYKGCELGCIYCFARPTHAYWDLSPGLDFETKILYKPNGPELLEQALRKPAYVCKPIAFGSNTDPYQPVDKQLGITRELLSVLQRYRHPFTIVTKGSHLLRDLDILQEMARDKLCSVMVSVTTLNLNLKRTLEPRAASPASRIDTVSTLAKHGVPVGILVAPIIPAINDHEIENILTVCSDAGATSAACMFLRLPLEVRDLFYQWLHQHHPQRAEHVISLIRQSRGGRDNQAEFDRRQSGEGVFAELIKKRFDVACHRLGLNERSTANLDCSLFSPPVESGDQMALF